MNVTIIGAGIAGLTTGIALRQIGITATIFESAPEIREAGAGIALSANAMRVFGHLGIAEAILTHGQQLSWLTIRNPKGKVLSRADSRKTSRQFGTDNFTIHRGALQQELLKQNTGNTIVTNKTVVDCFQNDDSVRLLFSDGTTHLTDYVIVADGIHSPIRQKLVPGSVPRYSGYTCWRGITDRLPGSATGPGPDLDMESSETWGRKGRFGIVPLAGNKLYWFAVVNAEKNDPLMQQVTTEWLLNHFAGYHSPIPEILQQTKNEQLIWSDISDLEPIAGYAYGRLLLIGDAAHATTPNMGQGACQAIEDAYVLSQELRKNEDPVKAFIAFEKRRLGRTHWIVNSSATLGRVAQTENRLLIAVRNTLMQLVPERVKQRQLKKILTTDF
jgi:2-polyprenyl-6-methoxyphenol hydroxylase-like FAD-dependent oxidoreductase